MWRLCRELAGLISAESSPMQTIKTDAFAVESHLLSFGAVGICGFDPGMFAIPVSPENGSKIHNIVEASEKPLKWKTFFALPSCRMHGN